MSHRQIKAAVISVRIRTYMYDDVPHHRTSCPCTFCATMTKISAILSLLAASAASVSAYNAKASLSGAAAKVEKSEAAGAATFAGRRDFLTSAAASLAFGLPAAASLVANPQPANAGAASDLTDVYFGVGCFWHIQVRY